MQPDEPSGYRIDSEQDAPPPSVATPPAHGQPAASSPPGPYAPPPGYIPASYGPPPSHGSPPAYGPPPAYGAPPSYWQPQAGWYGPPPAPWNAPLPSSRWPYGPDRPGMATAAAVLGFVTAGLTLIAGLVLVIKELTGHDDAPTAVLLLGIPCAAAQILGGVWLLRRRSRTVLLVSALAAVAVLIGALVAAAVDLPRQGFVGFLVFFFPALPLPVVTAVFAWQRTVSSWIAAAREAPTEGVPPHI